MPGTNEAFSRVKIDAQLKDQGWDVLNPNAVRFEYVLPDKTKANYVLCDRHGRALAVIEALGLDPAKVNVSGGAVALGHPLGATGAKLTAQLLAELRRRQARYGMVTMCVGGGMGAAGIFERL